MRTFSPRSLVIIAAVATLAGLLGGLGVLSRASAGGTSVSVPSTNVQLGNLGKVTVEAHGVPDPGLGAWTVDVHYDTSIMTVMSCVADHGGLCNAHYTKDKVRVTGTSLIGLQGEVSLGSIGFTCKTAGSSALTPSASVFADATIGHPEPIDVAMEAGKLDCTEGPAPTATRTPTPTSTPLAEEKIPGDADCDRLITAIDAELILQYTAGLTRSVPCRANADVNHDGFANAIDAALVLQIVVGIA